MALTKVTGQVINTSTDVTVGVLTVTNTLAVGGTVSIGGTLTYEDVTNIDSVGLVTARNGIVVGSGITLSKDGDGFFTGVTTATTFVGALTGNVTGNVTGNISGGTVAGSTGTFSSDVSVAGDFQVPDVIKHEGDVNTKIRFPAADTITAETAGDERLRIDSSGRVLIGTTDTTTIGTVASNLIIGSTTNNDEVALTLNVMEGANGRRVKFFLDDDDGVYGVDTTSTTGTAQFVVRHATSEKLRITSSGSVGIGTETTIATSKLDVVDGIINVGAAVTTHDSRIQFTRKDTGLLSWIGIPNWNPDALYIYGPKAASPYNEAAAIYESSTWTIQTAGSTRLQINSSGVIELDRGSATEQAIDIKTTATSGATRAIRFIESGTHQADLTYSHDNDRIELVGKTGQGAAIYTGGNLSQLIDSNGYRMLPRNVIFHAYSGQNIVPINTDIVFSQERFNIGGGYDTANGVFTAPVGGYYHFYAQIYRRDIENDCHWGFYLSTGGGFGQVSESRMQTNYGGDSGRGYSTLQCSLYWYMGVGHKMKCRVGNVGSAHCNPTLSYYCGNLVG